MNNDYSFTMNLVSWELMEPLFHNLMNSDIIVNNKIYREILGVISKDTYNMCKQFKLRENEKFLRCCIDNKLVIDCLNFDDLGIIYNMYNFIESLKKIDLSKVDNNIIQEKIYNIDHLCERHERLLYMYLMDNDRIRLLNQYEIDDISELNKSELWCESFNKAINEIKPK